jgi:nucleoside-diphosphate-sugar epimerase
MKTKNIVVAGAAGKLGRLVVRELLEDPQLSVTAIVRTAGRFAVEPKDAHRVTVVALDLVTASAAELASAVKDAYPVVSTAQGGPDVIVDGQLSLLRAARDAQVKRFLPSDYSFNFFSLPPGVNINSDWRRTFAARAEQERGAVEVVHLMQGMFADVTVLGFVGLFDAQENTVRYWGDGAAPIDWTTWEDTARFIAAAATDDRPVPSQLFVAGERLSMLEFAERVTSARGKAVTTHNLGTLDELRAERARRQEAEPHNVYAWLPMMYAEGMFSGQALLGPLGNTRYPQIQAESVSQALRRGAFDA